MLRLLLAVSLFACALSAQDNHYWTHQFGTRAALMGGAVIGGVNDTSAVYYNPGRLGWISNDSLKVSADGYQLATLTIKDGAGKGQDLTSTQGDIVPLAASGVQPQPAHRTVHAVHVDDDVPGVGIGYQRPAAAQARIGLDECGLECGFGGGIHPGQAEGQRHRAAFRTL